MRNLLTTMGEILVDFLPLEEHGATVGFRMHPGGSPFNVAVGLARLGQPAAFVSKLAGDFFGRYLRDYLERQGVATRCLLHDDHALSTLAFVAMEDGEPAYTFYREGAADTRLTAGEVSAACIDETRILHFGSISLLDGTTPDAVLQTVQRLQGQALLSFDPNLRPTMVRDEAAYRALIGRLLALSDLVKVSAADLAWLLPDASPAEAAAHLLAQGPALVVVTLAEAGALALRSEQQETPQQWHIPAFAVQVADTVGAGDSFSAGLLAALAEHDIDTRAALLALDAADLIEILRFAAAVSAITCTRSGANPPHRDEVAQFLGWPATPESS
jgi:fructokinase